MNSFKILRTTSENPDFVRLVAELDVYLAIRNGKDNDFFVQFNKIEMLHHVVLVVENDVAAGCGAFKEVEKEIVEIKRMFVPIDFRGKGIASVVLGELENWAKELGYKKSVLETGKDMIDAVGLYTKSNYQIVPNYGPYKEVESSVCFEKTL